MEMLYGEVDSQVEMCIGCVTGVLLRWWSCLAHWDIWFGWWFDRVGGLVLNWHLGSFAGREIWFQSVGKDQHFCCCVPFRFPHCVGLSGGWPSVACSIWQLIFFILVDKAVVVYQNKLTFSEWMWVGVLVCILASLGCCILVVLSGYVPGQEEAPCKFCILGFP